MPFFNVRVYRTKAVGEYQTVEVEAESSTSAEAIGLETAIENGEWRQDDCHEIISTNVSVEEFTPAPEFGTESETA